MTALTLRDIAGLLSGKVRGKEIIARSRFRQVRVMLNPMAPDGVIAVPNRPGDASIQECREYVLEKLRGIL